MTRGHLSYRTLTIIVVLISSISSFVAAISALVVNRLLEG